MADAEIPAVYEEYVRWEGEVGCGDELARREPGFVVSACVGLWLALGGRLAGGRGIWERGGG